MPPKKNSLEITYTMLSDIFIFVNILKLQFLPNVRILWQNFGKIQSLGPKFCETFPKNINETFGVATLHIGPTYSHSFS